MNRPAQTVAVLSFNEQRLRILHCTANAMANSPGGLQFKPGTRPWLEDVQNIRPLLSSFENWPVARSSPDSGAFLQQKSVI